MARVKMLALGIANGAAWLAVGGLTLATAYAGSAAAAHMGTWIQWR